MRSPSTSASTPAASGSGSGSAWTIVRRWVGRVEGDVQGAQALDLRSDDARRFDDDDAVDLEALGEAYRHDRDLGIESGGGRPPMGDAGSVEGGRDLAGHLVGDDHDDAHAAALGRQRRRRRGHRVTEVGGRRNRDDLGQGVALAHRSRGPQARRRGVHHSVGELHDLGRDAVADGQPGHPAGPAVREVVGDIAPARRRPRSGRLGEVADDGQRAVERPPGDHLQLHRREVLDLVDDDVAVRPDLVGVVDPAAAVGHRTEHLAGVVEQGDVGRRPAHVGDIVGPWSVERLDLGLVEHVASGEPQQRSGAEQVVEQLGRREHRPHPLEGGADLGDTAQFLAQLAARHVADRDEAARAAKNSPST